MASSYLSSGEYAAYGLPATTTAAQVTQASVQVDAFLKRREGCIWTPDNLGNPCYMAATTPSITLTSTGSIVAGAGVVVPYTGAALSLDQIGDVVIVDRASSTLVEACVITGIAAGTLTLGNVVNSHTGATTMDLGMVICEQPRLPKNRSIARLAKFPALRLLSGYGQYGYGRRLDQISGQYAEFNLLANISAFGGPPQWVQFDVTQAQISFEDSAVWVPAGILLAYFTEVRLRYIAGWSAANLPTEIKQATANLVLAKAELPISSGVRSFRDSATGISVDRFGATLFSDDTKDLLAPYQARLFA